MKSRYQEIEDWHYEIGRRASDDYNGQTRSGVTAAIGLGALAVAGVATFLGALVSIKTFRRIARERILKDRRFAYVVPDHDELGEDESSPSESYRRTYFARLS